MTIAAQTRAAAYSVRGAPTAVVHVPRRLRSEARRCTSWCFCTAISGCANVLAERRSRALQARRSRATPSATGWELARHHDAAGTNTLFVIPQLAFMRRDGRPGCFAKRGCFRRFLTELLQETLAEALGGPRTLRDVGSVTLVAHSAGYQAALAILEHGEVGDLVRTVVLMDALYGHSARYARWLLERAPDDARVLTFYLGRGKTYRESRAALHPRPPQARRPPRPAERVQLLRAQSTHALVPARHLSEVLAEPPPAQARGRTDT